MDRIEECCFNDTRDFCIGPQCRCGCHKAPRQTRRDWEAIKIADFERLENALKQIIWQADATEPLSVKAAEIARTALSGQPTDTYESIIEEAAARLKALRRP